MQQLNPLDGIRWLLFEDHEDCGSYVFFNGLEHYERIWKCEVTEHPTEYG